MYTRDARNGDLCQVVQYYGRRRTDNALKNDNEVNIRKLHHLLVEKLPKFYASHNTVKQLSYVEGNLVGYQASSRTRYCQT